MTTSRATASPTDLLTSRPFDSFPYVLTRVVPALYHVILLPEVLGDEEAEAFARQQAAANRLPTCLVLSAVEARYVTPDGRVSRSAAIPRGGILVADRLKPCRRVPETPALARRREQLAAVLAEQRQDGVMFGDLTKGGRKATYEESVLFAGVQRGGVPRGLTECAGCGRWRGHCLDPSPQFQGMLVTVHCRCDNDNRCAACGALLYPWKLNANYYRETDHQVWHVPGFCGFSHRCEVPHALL